MIRLQFTLLTFFISCLVHDESCFRSGETTAKRWIFSEETKSFFNKGRGKSVMISEFLVSHLDNSFFELSHEGWKAAVSRYPELMEETDIDYIERSASRSIQVGYDRYFDNNAIVSQFTRLFKMVPFKKAYANNSIHVVVDNMRLHSAKGFSLDEFGMKTRTRCPVDQIQYIDDHGQQKTIQCYFTSGTSKKKSKGLVKIAEELKISLHENIKLKELKELLVIHKVFQNVRKSLITVFDIIVSLSIIIFSNQNWTRSLSNIIFKLPSRLNFTVSSTVLRVYGSSKNNSFESKLIKRSRTMINLIANSRINFVKRNIVIKLYGRF